MPARSRLRCLSLAVALASCAPSSGPVRSPAASPRDSRLPDSLLALMTPEEKIGQLIMAPADWDQTGPRAPGGGDARVRQGRIGSFLNFWGAAATRRMQRVAVEESRLHLPLLFGYDVIHGWRTIFPVPLAEAASFDTAAVQAAARIGAIEASAHGVHWTFAPMVDIARDARWGRIVEGAGEDPFLGAAMAAARVRGFQGDGLSSPGAIMATAKHFAAYGAAESGRDYNVADLSERTMWEVYLPPFEAAVRAGAASIMASFNEIGGTPAHASRWLLDDVLRKGWGFQGLVLSDWTGVEELLRHGIAAEPAGAATRALSAGVDVEMSSTTYEDLLPAVKSGAFPRAVLDSAVLRVLRAKQALGLFDDPYRYSDTVRERLVTLTAEHRAASRALARESIVLLKNDPTGSAPTLPLRKDLRSVAVIGPLADDARSSIGNWAGVGKPEDAITLLAGTRAALPNAEVLHARGALVDTVDTGGFAEAERMAREAEAVLLVLGEREDMSAEAASRASVELPGSQEALAKAVMRAARAAGSAKPIVVLLMNGRPLAIPWLADSVPAIVETWFLGVEHGHAVADVIFGDHNPAGRLPVSFPRATGQVPIYCSRKPTGRPPVASEKYTSKYLDVHWTPQWPFGYGLSYTTFAYSDLRLSADSIQAGDSVRVSVAVRNTGSRPGVEVVQLYVRDDVASVTRPIRALKGFARIELQPGQSREVQLTIRPADLSLYDLNMRRAVEPGGFTVYVGGSSAAELEGRFRVVGDTLVLAEAPPRMR